MMLDSKPIFQLYLILVLLLPIGSSLPCGGDEDSVDYAGIVQEDPVDDVGCGSRVEGVDSNRGASRRSSVGCAGLIHACVNSDSFCFLSTLPVSPFEEDDCEGFPLKDFGLDMSAKGRAQIHKLSNGKEVSCSLIATGMASHRVEVDRNGFGKSDAPSMPPDSWMLDSRVGSIIDPVDSESSFVDDPLLAGNVDIHPHSLDWGVKDLYSPSFAYLTVTNMHNESKLYVNELYSNDPQFYSHDFEELCLQPGEATTIKFVFLPRRLGPVSASIVLRTSFGRFDINAVGVAVESSFNIQSFVGLEFSGNGRVTKVVALYNPFDEVVVVEEVMLRYLLVSRNQSDHSQVSCHRHMDSMRNSYDNGEDDLNNLGHVAANVYGSLFVEMNPVGKWEIPPHESETILDMTMVSSREGNASGFICIRLKHFTRGINKLEIIIFPLEVKSYSTIGYHTTTGPISIFVDPLPFSDSRKPVLVMSLRNDDSELISILKITENNRCNSLFGIKYAKGLLLYPGSVTQIASITCPSLFEGEDGSFNSLKDNPDCSVHVVTNGSAASAIHDIDIPCQDLHHACLTQIPGSQSVTLDDVHKGHAYGPEKPADLTSASSKVIDNGQFIIQSKFLRTFEANEFILRSWKSQGALRGNVVLEEKELIFPNVEVGRHCSQWIRVKNPSQKPVIMQLLLNSESAIHHCKLTDDVLQHSISQASHRGSIGSLYGFYLPRSAITEAFVHPFDSVTLGPIVFRPFDKCMWSSSALVKNNLSGVEWLPIQGAGSSNFMVIFENSMAIQKLDFSVNWSLPLNISSLETKFLEGNTPFTCAKLLSKELRVKNVGELPLEVVKLQVSGIGCELDGFTVHTCKGFSLSPGETAKLLISYQPDFLSSVISRDLKVTLSSGVIVIPMKANIPDFMVKLCRKSFFWSFLRMVLLLVFIVSSIAVLYSIGPHVAHGRSSDLVGTSNEIATINKVGKTPRIHRHPKNIRAPNEELQSEVVIIGRYSDNQDSAPDHTTNSVEPKLQDVVCHEGDLIIPACSELKPKGESGPIVSDISKSTNLTIKTGREKGKRRKRRASGLGSGLTSKLEVCSSQSGNSTPSSPLSPNLFTLKQVHPLSPDMMGSSYTKDLMERNLEKHSVRGCSDQGKGEHSERQLTSKQFVVPCKLIAKPLLTPSATFPISGCRAPALASSAFLAPTSPVAAPYARAPGSNLGKDKNLNIKRAEEPTASKEFTYDIWGNHLSDHIMGRSKEHSPRAFAEASEGESLSFFARGPQTLMKMSSVRSGSPGPKLPSYDVSHGRDRAIV